MLYEVITGSVLRGPRFGAGASATALPIRGCRRGHQRERFEAHRGVSRAVGFRGLMANGRTGTRPGVVITGGARTPIGKFGGALKKLPASELGIAAVRGALEKSKVPASSVDEVIFGNGRQAGVRPNVV